MSKLDSIIKEINKEYKEEIAFNGNDAELIKYEKVPFSSPRLNYMMYGGLPMGRMIEFAGAERSGKTTTALDMVKQCQIKFAEEAKKNKTEKRRVCFVDAENTFDVEWATKLGVNVKDLLLIKPQEQYAEQIFEIMRTVIETGEIGLIVLDSVAQLVSKSAFEEDIEKKQYGGIAMSLTKFCNIIVPLLGKYNCMCIMINQVREDLNNPYNEFITPGGRGFKHNCSVRLMFQQGNFIDVNNKELTRGAENPAGNLVKVKIEKDDNAIWYTIGAEDKLMKYIVEKGSIAIDGISLTVSKVDNFSFSVSIIPHTAKETILSHKSVGDIVNLENDVIGKYVDKLINFSNKNNKVESNITREFLIKNGY